MSAVQQYNGCLWLQIFDMFISSMTTYRPLLLRIKQAYEAALEDAVASAYDHVHLHTELSLMPHRHVGSTCMEHNTHISTLDEAHRQLQWIQE